MRQFCWYCHRPEVTCFCSFLRPFVSPSNFILIVHPSEARSTVGTAWILRRSITNLTWLRSKGPELDENLSFLELLNQTNAVPLLLFPGPQAFNLSRDPTADWEKLTSKNYRPLWIVIDGTWTQARSILRKSKLLQTLPRVSFDTNSPSEYGFKKQPRPECLSSVEGVHRVIEILAERGWGSPPPSNEHHQMITLFRKMVKFQMKYEK